MGTPGMDPSNAFARINERLLTHERMIRELAAASGTLASATIYKGGLRITAGGSLLLDGGGSIIAKNGLIRSESNVSGAASTLYRSILYLTPDLTDTEIHSARVMVDPGSEYRALRLLPPYSTGTGGENSVTIIGRGGTDAARVAIEGDTVDILSGGNLRLFELPTTGSAANLRLESGTAIIQYVTSSQRYKEDVADAVVDIADVLSLQPKTWVDKGSIDRSEPGDITRNIGFIAEDLDALPSMRQFVDYDEDGRPDAIQYDRLSAVAITLAQHQAEQITSLQDQIDALSSRLAAVESALPQE